MGRDALLELLAARPHGVKRGHVPSTDMHRLQDAPAPEQQAPPHCDFHNVGYSTAFSTSTTKIVVLAAIQFAHDFVHFSSREGPAGCRVDVAHCSQMQNGSGGRFVIWSFQD